MKFHGNVGFVKSVEIKPGVFENQTIERPYYGDKIRSSRRWDTPVEINNKLNLSDEIEIVADDYAWENYGFMAYVVIRNQKWCINYIEEKRPRIRLTLGGIYNGSNRGQESATP